MIPADGPDAALTRIVNRLRLPRGAAQIGRAVAAHPRPNSLLALVDVATDLGLRVTPGKSDEIALAELNLPVIVHFEGEGGGGFGVLEGVSARGFEVWDSRNGSHLLERDVFLPAWSGVVALIEPDPAEAAPKTSYLRHRVGEILAGGLEPPAIVGSRAAPVLRIILGVLLLSLLTLAISSRSAPERAAWAAIVVLSIAGLLVTTVMSVAIADYGGPFSPGICRRGKLVDCQSVLTSRFARIAGFPLSDLGISFYAATLLFIAIAGAVVGGSLSWQVVGAVYMLSLPIAVVLIGVQIFMRRLCTLCLAVHAINGVAAATFLIFLRDAGSGSGIVPSVLLFALLYFLMLYFVIPYLKTNEALRRLSLSHGRMSASPYASLAQLVTEIPTGLRGSECGIRLDDTYADHELIVFVHPSCGQCDPVLREARSLARAGRVKAFVAVPPKDPDVTDRKLCRALVSIGLSMGADTMVQAYGIAKRNFRRRLADDPVDLLAEELSLPAEALGVPGEDAISLVARAEEFAREHVEGTPAVFFNSRPYGGPLAHLVLLIERHPDLLPPPGSTN